MPDPLDIKLNVSGNIPGEQLVVAIFNYAAVARQTMSQENRDAYDKQMLEAWRRWNDFWIKIGLIAE
jgi:hypothetical protein